MNPTAARSFLHALGVTTFGRARTGWVVCACPLGPWRHQDGSGKASFGLKTSAGLGGGPALAKCFSCDFVGTPAELLYEMLGRNRLSPSGKRYDFAGALAILADQSASASASGAAAQAAAAVAMVSPGLKSIDEATWGAPAELVFPESWLARFEPAYAAAGEVHPYLAGRGVPWRVARDLDLRFDTGRGRVCFPVRDGHGRLRGLHGRSIRDDVGLRYLMYTLPDPRDPAVRRCNPDVWLGEAWVDPDRPVVVVESVFDLARVYQCYRNVIAPLSASLNARKLARLAGIATLVPMFDADKAGAQALARLTRALRGTAIVPVQSIGGHEDPGAAPVEAVAGILARYVALDPILA